MRAPATARSANTQIAVVRAAHARGCSLCTFTHTYRLSFLNTAVTGCDLT